jgi:hypothetical protein
MMGDGSMTFYIKGVEKEGRVSRLLHMRKQLDEGTLLFSAVPAGVVFTANIESNKEPSCLRAC